MKMQWPDAFSGRGSRCKSYKMVMESSNDMPLHCKNESIVSFILFVFMKMENAIHRIPCSKLWPETWDCCKIISLSVFLPKEVKKNKRTKSCAKWLNVNEMGNCNILILFLCTIIIGMCQNSAQFSYFIVWKLQTFWTSVQHYSKKIAIKRFSNFIFHSLLSKHFHSQPICNVFFIAYVHRI